MEKLKNIPSLRFLEFDGEWEERKLGQVTNYVDYRGRAPIKTESGNFLVTAKNIKKGFIDYECSKEYVAESNYSIVMSKGIPKIGDVLFTTEAPMGNVAMVDKENIALAQRVIKFRGHEFINNSYLLYYMLSDIFQKNITQKSIGTTVQGISGKELHQIKFSHPLFDEQTKISSFLTAVDDKLQSLKQKKTLLEQHKKGVMQKIFSQELRFKDDNGNEYPDWEEKKLGDIGYTYNGLTGKTKEHFGNGKPYIQYKQIFDDSKIDISRFELVKISPSENQNKVVFGDVFFTVSSETPNEIGTASVLLNDIDELYLNSFCFGYRASKLTLSPYFSRYLFRNELFRNQIIKLAQGSTRFNMSKLQLIKLIVKLPCLEEQTKIANFLNAIDDKINHCHSQIEKTEVWKKGLLQQMFC
jgi:type I restriction enzyme S subunit